MNTNSNIPLKVPFKEKDEAKSLGARWNPDGKHWYIPIGINAAPFEKWLDGALPAMQQPAMTQQPISQTQNKPLVKANHLPTDADMDDINALLRDAYEVPND